MRSFRSRGCEGLADRPLAASVRPALRRAGTLALLFALSNFVEGGVLASPASEADSESRIDGAGTVIIGGTNCQLIALDDGRFVALKSGALPKVPLPVKARIKIVAEPLASVGCAHALSVDVKAFHRLPDITKR